MGRQTTALIAEDEPSVRRLLEEILKLRGYRTTAVGEGAAALERARAERPDVVVLDQMLPDGDGLQVLERLKADPELSATPVVIVTGWQEASLRDRMREAGAYAVVDKPFDVQALADLVDEAVVMARRAAERARSNG